MNIHIHTITDSSTPQLPSLITPSCLLCFENGPESSAAAAAAVGCGSEEGALDYGRGSDSDQLHRESWGRCLEFPC